MSHDEIVHAHYERGRTVRLVGQKDDYEVEYPDVFYIRSHEAARLPKSWERNLLESENGFTRVKWPEGERYSRVARLKYFNENVFKPKQIEPLEADISPVQRFLVENSEIKIASDFRLLYFDLETEKVKSWDRPWESRILSFSWRSSNGKGGHVRTKALTDEAEADMLRVLARLADRHDILLAWNGEGFDFPVVKNRMNRFGIDFDPYLHHWIDHLKLFKRYYLRSEDGSVTSSFSLNAIAGAFLGETKVPVEHLAKERGWDEKGDLFTWVWQKTPDLLASYNDHDTILMELLEKKTGFIALHIALCRLCRVLPGSHSLFPMTLVDGRMLLRGFEAGYHFPSRIREDGDDKKIFEKAAGAYVLEADVGLHESVAVLDYTRMYPSIILSFNMSPETFDPNGELSVPETDKRGHVTGKEVARFRAAPEGHIPAALRGVLKARDVYSERKSKSEIGSPEFHDADRLSQACKALANSFYGVILSPMARFYKQEIGESVTSVGRWLLSATIQAAEQRDHKLVFGDTDSIAIKVSGCEDAQSLKTHMNTNVIPEMLKSRGVPVEKSEVKIDYEKRYSRLIVAASKKYAGRFALYKGKPAPDSIAPDVRGLEIVRSDVCRAARALQKEVIFSILDGAPFEQLRGLILNTRKEFWENGAPHVELILSKGVSKPLDEYKVEPVQVRIARRMVDSGKEVGIGAKIPYLYAKGKEAFHPEELDGREIDRVLYWNKYIFPPSERVLQAAFPDFIWKELRLNPKTAIAGQAELFSNEQSFKPKARRVKAIDKGDPKSLVVIHSKEHVDASKLKAVLETFPGTHPLKMILEIRSEIEKSDVEMRCPQFVDDPNRNKDFQTALRALGVTVSDPQTLST